MENARVDLIRLCRKAEASHEIVFFPHAGGSPNQYRALASRLEIGRTCSCVLLPGRQSALASPPLDNLTEAAAAVAACIEVKRPPNLILWGHSLGAILAYEVSVLLEKRDIFPSLLVVSAQNAPVRTYPRPAIHDADEAHFIQEMLKYGGTPSDFVGSKELLELLVPTLRADFKMVETYSFDGMSVISSPVLALVGTDDPFIAEDECGGWAERTNAAFKLERLPGKHFFLQENIEQIDKILTATIRALETQDASRSNDGVQYG